MGGTGKDPLPGNKPGVNALTQRERMIYEWACVEVRARRDPSMSRIAEFMGFKGCWDAYKLRNSIRKKVGWPCQYSKTAGGTHGLTPRQREVLLTAISLWEDGREYPSRRLICAVMEVKSSKSAWFGKTMRKLEAMNLLPFRRRVNLLRYTENEKEFIRSRKLSGRTYLQIKLDFSETYGKSVSRRMIHKFLSSGGLARPYATRVRGRLESIKAEVIAQRGGKIPDKLEDPSSYRAAMRRLKMKARAEAKRSIPVGSNPHPSLSGGMDHEVREG